MPNFLDNAEVSLRQTFRHFRSSSATRFSYKPLRPSLKEIRVLDVEPGPLEAPVHATLRHVSLSALPRPQYEAVSYCWGDGSLRAEMVLDGHGIDVPSNSEEALRGLRDLNERKTLWIDAICINQRDIRERSQQVTLMGDIYRNARCSLFWLGKADNCTSTAFLCIQSLLRDMKAETKDLTELNRKLFNQFGDFLQASPLEELSDTAIAAIEGIFQRPWFGRIWVVQEASLPAKCICHCGTYVAPMVDILRVGAWIRHKFQYSDDSVISCQPDIENVFNIWDRADPQYGRAVTLGRPDFSFALATCGKSFQASDPRDQIFGLLGLATFSSNNSSYVPPLLTPDYEKSVEEVFRDATLFVIDDLKGLWLFSEVWHRETDNDSRFPSWVPRWDHPWTSAFDAVALATGLFNAGGQLPEGFDVYRASVIPGTLELQGIVADRVQAVGHRWRHRDNMSEFPAFVEECYALVNGHSRYLDRDKRTKAVVRALYAGAKYDSSCACDFCCPDLRNQFDAFVESVQAGHWGSYEETSPIFRAILLRRLCITPTYIGLVPHQTREGDIIAVLFGSALPFLLRPQGAEYSFIGTCYVEGIMNGELVKELDADDAKLETFRLR